LTIAKAPGHDLIMQNPVKVEYRATAPKGFPEEKPNIEDCDREHNKAPWTALPLELVAEIN